MRLIVGVDPGATVGLAVLEASSSPGFSETFSSRNFSFSDIVAWLSEKGEPLVIATDRAKPPALVKRLAATFGARLWSPPQDMRQTEKIALVAGHRTGSDHEQDALAAARAAQGFFSDTLGKVERHAPLELQGAVKHLLITGRAANIEMAVAMLLARREQRMGKERLRTRDRFTAQILQELADARQRNAHLERQLSASKMVQSPRGVLRSGPSAAAFKQLQKSHDTILAEKDATIADLERIICGTLIVAVPYHMSARDDKFAGRAVIVAAPEPALVRRLEASGAVALVTDRPVNSSLPVLIQRNADIRAVGTFLVIERAALAAAEQQHDFVSWLDAYRQQRKETFTE